MDKQAEKALFSTAELEGYTGIPVSTWEHYRLHKIGPPSFILGRRRVYRREAVNQWLAEQEAESQRRDATKAGAGK